MRGKTFATAVVLSLAGLAAAAPAWSGPSLLANGSFDAGNVGFISGYTYAPGNIWDAATYDVVADPIFSHPLAASFRDHTSGNGLMLAVNGAVSAGQVVWSQTVNVAAGTRYEFGGWASSWGGGAYGNYDPDPAAFLISINGVDLGAVVQLSGFDGAWTDFSFLWGSTDLTSALIELRLVTTGYTGNDPAFDDFRFVAIPEPATIALLGLGVVGAGLARRRAAPCAG